MVKKTTRSRPKAAKREHEHPADRQDVTASLAPLPNRLNLKSVRLIESHAELHIAGKQVPSELATRVEVNFGVQEEDNNVLGNVRVTLQPKDMPEQRDAEPRPSFLGIIVQYQCLFEVDVAPVIPKLPDDEVQAVQRMIVYLAWPYLRQHIFGLTASMAIPPFTLPLMRVQLATLTKQLDPKSPEAKAE